MQSNLQLIDNDQTPVASEIDYIQTTFSTHRPERIDAILEKRVREFLLARRQRKWTSGEEMYS